jgi:HlyD family secretion protein
MDVIKPKKFWNKQKTTFTIIGLTLIAFIAYLVIFSDKRTKLNVDAEKITISDVKEGNFDEFIIVQGAVQPLKTIQLDAIVGGYVTQKLVEGGTKVAKGEIILRLENQQLKLNFLQSETEANRLVNDLQNTRQRLKVEKFTLRKTLSELEFLMEQAKDAYERNTKLIKDNVISESDFQKSKREYERYVNQRGIEIESQKYQEESSNLQIKQLEGTLQSTQRNVDLWRETLENLVVKAPVSGLLSSIDVEVGSNINQGQNIGQIDDLEGFKMRSDIDEHYISRIFPGLRGSFEFNGKSHEIEIIKVYPEVKNGRFSVDLTFTGQSPEGIRRGQSSPVRLELGKAEKAILVPVGGFFSDTGGNWIYVVDASGKKAIKRNISLGRKNPEYFEVLSGLKAGDKAITSGYENFGDKEVLVF